MTLSAVRIPKPYLPKGHDIEFMVGRYRETASLARIAWERGYDRKLPRWLHRLTMPILLLWGEKDKLIPAQQGDTWAKLVPGAQLRVVKGSGHLIFNEQPDSVKEVADFLM